MKRSVSAHSKDSPDAYIRRAHRLRSLYIRALPRRLWREVRRIPQRIAGAVHIGRRAAATFVSCWRTPPSLAALGNGADRPLAAPRQTLGSSAGGGLTVPPSRWEQKRHEAPHRRSGRLRWLQAAATPTDAQRS